MKTAGVTDQITATMNFDHAVNLTFDGKTGKSVEKYSIKCKFIKNYGLSQEDIDLITCIQKWCLIYFDNKITKTEKEKIKEHLHSWIDQL